MIFGLAAEVYGQRAGFGGPAVSGRSLGAGVVRRSQQVTFRPFVSLRANYNDGLAAARLQADGSLDRGAAYGYEIAGGAYGSKAWRKTEVSGSFIAGYRQRSLARSLTGFNMMGYAGVSQMLSRRLRLNTTNGYGSITQSGIFGFGVITPFQDVDPAFDETPLDEAFDNRVTFLNNSNSLIFQQSSRLSFSATGGVFVVDRRNGLPDSRGVNARGDVNFQLDRQTTVGLYYSFNNFNFQGAYGNSNLQQMGLLISRKIGRSWNVLARGGVFSMENEGIQRVELDPAVAEILGTSQGAVSFYSKNFLPSWELRALGRLQRSSFGASTVQTVRAGNGVFLTSRTQSFRGFYSYQANRRLSIQLNASRVNMSGRLRFRGRSENTTVGSTIGYQIAPGFQVHGTVGWRWQEIVSENSLRNSGIRAQIGISYSPGDIPLALW